MQFLNNGTCLTKAAQFKAGTYKLACKLETLTKVDLVEPSTSNRETLLIKSGMGATSFTVAAGRYAFDIAPQDNASAWLIEISPLGLPSQHP